MVRAWKSPGAVALLRTPSGTWHGAAGFSNLSTKTTMRPDDRFWIGSVTKTFLATVVLQLAGEGRLRLDDKVARWFPGIVPSAGEISVRQLLNHTSGIYDYFRDPTLMARLSKDRHALLTPRAKIARAAAHPLDFRPGSSWSYSNTNYLVLGLIVEKVTGHRIGDELERRIFEPLGLDNTTFASGSRAGVDIVRGYNLMEGTPRDATLDTLGGPWADGAIVSNTDDLAHFFEALLGGDLLSKDLLGAMEATVPDPYGGAYGLGISRRAVWCGAAWGHNGGTPGYLTVVFASRDGARIAVVATNGAPVGLEGAAEHIYCWR